MLCSNVESQDKSENSCTCRVCIREREVQVSLKSSKAWLRYERNKYTNKLTTNRKPIHGGQRVCEENKLEKKTTAS